ncbi:fructose bisphosphate aldolase [Formosa algae]|uniref:fructose-bisphosphate aldolase n=1 Tax=Formosa algae TaxID=225843 RepID=A0A9X1CC64_9FLAO|nr:fructose bisphosphate aldolase [Formosa algae]MBP1839930.1 fructose-bisphosphate aldolase class I [Formosa algae]MDQ0335529.1 fructose-bisphosphate aldolase class I [Formosa algae]OEI81769.1 fructose bisphosphate aldolase [Formosa algae]PNW26260.1 fructose bisphosphate aldolase [Formosa algae]
MYTFQEQLERIKDGKGFIAALDQSGGSTPKALLGYGVTDNQYKDETEMFQLIHNMRTRVISDKNFSQDKILGVILFEKTMKGLIANEAVPSYLLEKHIVPFLKIDKGLEDLKDGVKLMKPIPNLESRLSEAKGLGIFGTKMRSVIYEDNIKGISDIVKQQFAVGAEIIASGLVPILEPEVDIHAEDKPEIEAILKKHILLELDKLKADQSVILKLTLPTVPDFYKDLVNHAKVVRVFALSGGYDIDTANTLLTKNKGVIASFSRALLNDLKFQQSETEFSTALAGAIDSIYKASIT